METAAVAYRYAILLALLLTAHPSFAETRCLDAEGEAAIANNDLPSARAEAISRAKWAAVEQAVGVEVKAQSVVQNMALVDESISKQINGSVKSYRLLGEDSRDEVLTVRLNACVESAKAKNAVAGLALNNAISVFLLAKDSSGKIGGYSDSNAVAETLIGKLADKGYTVTDIAASHALDDKVVEAAMKSGQLQGLRSVMYRYLTNLVLVGRVDYDVSTRKGENIGYGISTPFNSVKARLTYRLISKTPAGEMVVLAADTEQGKGLAATVEDAAAESLKDLAEQLAPAILSKVEKHLQGAAKKVAVRVNGITELGDNFNVKELIQNIAWVTRVDEKGLGEFTVSYPENTVYLANSMRQKGNFRIEGFTPDSITVVYSR
jgi:peptidyl-tRNA hydrolase